MPLPRRQRQWDIYKANLGESSDCLLLVVSSDETNEILESEIVACEVVPEGMQNLPVSPLTIKAKPEETGLAEPATLSIATLASIPRNCLVNLEGRLDPVALRTAVLKGVHILIGSESWPP